MHRTSAQLELFPVDTYTNACTPRWTQRKVAAKKGISRCNTATRVKRNVPGISPKCVQPSLFKTKCIEADPFALELLAALREVIEEDEDKELFGHLEQENAFLTVAELVRLQKDMRNVVHV